MNEAQRQLQHGVVRAVGVIGAATLASRVLGFVRDMVMARAFGAGPVTDAFFVAFRIPNLLRRLLAEGALSTAIIPVFTEYLERAGRAEFGRMVRAVTGVAIVVLCVVSGLGMLLAPWIVRVMAPGWADDPELIGLAGRLTTLMFPYLLLVGLAALAMGALNAQHRFFTAALGPAVLNVAMILSVLFLAGRMSPPVFSLAVGVLVGGAGQLFVQLPELARMGVPLRPSAEWSHPAVRLIAVRLWPAVFALAAVQVTVLVNTLLASLLPEGTVSYLYYADRVMEFPLGVFGIALATAAMPSMAGQAARGEHRALVDTLGFSLRLSAFVALPAAVALVALGHPIVRLLFERGEFIAGRCGRDDPGPGRLRGRPARVLGHADRRADILRARRHADARVGRARVRRRQPRVRAHPHVAAPTRGACARAFAVGLRQPAAARLVSAPAARADRRPSDCGFAASHGRRVGGAPSLVPLGRRAAGRGVAWRRVDGGRAGRWHARLSGCGRGAPGAGARRPLRDAAAARAILAGGGERVIDFVMRLWWVGYAPVTASAVRKGRYRGVAVSGPRRD